MKKRLLRWAIWLVLAIVASGIGELIAIGYASLPKR
jgi:hypothetical protein